jgi:hypothetical protein
MCMSRLVRHAATVALAWAVGAGIAAAQTPAQTRPQAAPATPSGTAQIGGVIKSAADDKPLARARVVAIADVLPEPRAVITDPDGKYLFPDLPAGAYIITATRTGYAPQTYGQGRTATGTPVTVTSTQQLAGIDMALAPGGLIVGRILDEDGTPFAGAVVEALVTRSEGGRDTLFSMATSQTDDRGEFRLFGLAPGQYYVSAQDPAFRSVSSAKGIQHYSPTYYPGTPFADQAKTINVTGAGNPPRAEFRIKLVPPARVSGQLTAFDGRQLLSGAVIMSPLEGEGVPMVPPEDISIQPDGRFSFGQVVPGRYQIRARGQTDAAGGALFAVFSTEVIGNDIDGIRMTLRPGAILDGSVILETRHGTKPPVMSTLRVRAPFVDGNSFGDALTGTVQADGSYAIRGIMTGAHQIALEGVPAPWVLKSVTLHGADITDLELDVAERQQFHDVRITITDAGSEVSGIVQNARDLPVANMGVMVFAKVPLFWMRTNRRMRMTYTDREGRFSVPGLPAGEYLAIASASIDQSDLGRPDRLHALQPLAVPFRLASDSDHATVTLRVAPQPMTPSAVR